jgi:anti-sigma regulatory factor (Ser/Thr protein kinase)
MSAAVEAPTADPFVHPALFYNGPKDYLAGTVPFVREGLAAGEPVAVAVPGPNLELIRTELGPRAASVRLIDMTQAGRNPGRIIPGVLRAFVEAHPGRRVRIIGEPIWAGRSPVEYPACAQHEALINMAFTGQPVTILCPYDVERLEPSVIADAVRTHPVLVGPDDGWRDSDGYAPDSIVADYNQPLPPPIDAVSFAFDRSSLAKARRFAAEQVGLFGLPGDRTTDLVQVVGELAANSIVHGGGGGTLRVWAESGHVVCEVSDSGHIRDPLAGRRPVTTTQLNGRGLLLVNLLSDLVRLHTSERGTTIRVFFKL